MNELEMDQIEQVSGGFSWSDPGGLVIMPSSSGSNTSATSSTVLGALWNAIWA